MDIEVDWLKKWNLYSPKALAFVDVANDRSFSYSDFFSISNGLSLYLKEKGVKKGDRVSVLSENKIEMVFLFFALQRLGAVLVPLNFRLTAKEIEFMLSDSGSKLLFYSETQSEKVEALNFKNQALPFEKLVEESKKSVACSQVTSFEGDIQTPCMILYTSGTTGFPKGVVITHRMLFWNSINTSLSLNLSQNDCMISFLPLFHVGGWNVLLTPFIHRGAKTVFLPKFEPEQILTLIPAQKVTVLFGVPTIMGMLTKEPSFADTDLSSVRFAVVGGEPMPLEMIKKWHSRKVFVRQGFGLTECGPNCFSLNECDAETKIGSIGRPNFYVQTKIINEHNKEAAPNEVGELLLKGPMCMTEYWNNIEATEKTFLNGWLKTGDLVKQDPQGYFYVAGRKKEMFISGGENVYPAEVEKVLHSHPDIEEAAVVGVADSKWGEVGKAFVVKKKDSLITEQDLSFFCRDSLAKFKTPKHFTFLEQLPKGDSGKISKKSLMEDI